VKPLAALVGLVVACAVAPATAQAYKWKDASGKVHFSDEPPPDRKADKLTIKPQMPEDPAAAARSRDWRTQLQESGVRRQEQQDREMVEQRNKQVAENRCLSAQRHLDGIKRSRGVFRVNKEGQREYLEDQERAAAQKAAEERVERECR